MSHRSPWDRTAAGRLSRRRVLRSGLGLSGIALAGPLVGACTSAPAAVSTPAVAPTTAAAPAPVATPTAAPARPKVGGTLRTSGITGGAHNDPHEQTSAISALTPIMTYSGLLKFKHGRDVAPASTIPVPDLAESYEQPDDLTYVFKLRRGVKFQNIAPVNGREVTAQDVLYSYQRILDLKTLAPTLAGTKSIEALDNYTFRITLSEPNADYLVGLGANNLAVVAREAVAVNGDLKQGPYIGTGPWIVEKNDPVEGVTLARNPDYFLRGLPYLDKLVCFRLRDPQTIVSAFRGKELDVIGSGLGPELTAPLGSLPDVKVIDTPLGADELAFKTDRPPFNDLRLRQAVSKALDREALIGGVYAGVGSLTGGLALPDTSWELPQDELKRLLRRDLDGARRLMAEAGVPNGFPMELNVANYRNGAFVTMAELAQQQLREVGIRAEIKVLDAAQWTQVVRTNGEFSCYLDSASGRLTTNGDLLARYHSRGARNFTKFADPEIDRLIEQQAVLSRDPNRRKALIQDLQRKVIEKAFLSPLFYPGQQNAHWTYVRDYYMNASITVTPAPWMEVWLDK
jgi:ABC-type transport system substrate-binding protein